MEGKHLLKKSPGIDSQCEAEMDEPDQSCACKFSRAGKRKHYCSECSSEMSRTHPINDIMHWHNAIRRELDHIAKEARNIEHSQGLHDLSAFNMRLHFIADVCIFHRYLSDKFVFTVSPSKNDVKDIETFVWLYAHLIFSIMYSIAEDQIIFPAVDGQVSFAQEHAEEERQFTKFRSIIETIQNDSANSSSMEFHSKLCLHADQIIDTIQKHFSDEEANVSSVP